MRLFYTITMGLTSMVCLPIVCATAPMKMFKACRRKKKKRRLFRLF